MRARAIARPRYKLQDRFCALLDADGVDQAEHVVVEHIVKRANVFFLQAFTQVFGGNEAAVAVGEVTSGAIAKRDERGVRESHHVRFAVDVEFCVDGVGVARRDAVPHVRKTAVVDLAGEFRGYVEDSDERAHGPAVGQRRLCDRVTFVFFRFARHGLSFSVLNDSLRRRYLRACSSEWRLPPLLPTVGESLDRSAFFPVPPGTAARTASGCSGPSGLRAKSWLSAGPLRRRFRCWTRRAAGCGLFRRRCHWESSRR